MFVIYWYVQESLARIQTRKFLPLMYQLAARLGTKSYKNNDFQRTLNEVCGLLRSLLYIFGLYVFFVCFFGIFFVCLFVSFLAGRFLFVCFFVCSFVCIDVSFLSLFVCLIILFLFCLFGWFVVLFVGHLLNKW